MLRKPREDLAVMEGATRKCSTEPILLIIALNLFLSLNPPFLLSLLHSSIIVILVLGLHKEDEGCLEKQMEVVWRKHAHRRTGGELDARRRAGGAAFTYLLMRSINGVIFNS